MPGLQVSKRSGFLELPGEIRESIYHELLRPNSNKQNLDDGYTKYAFDLNLFLVNRQVYHEAREVFRRDNIFVSVGTPWSEAESHVAIDGYVPVVITGEAAERFNHQHLTVTIDAPQYRTLGQPLRRFILLLDDLPMFCEMWYYADLTHVGLNYHLRLTLKLQDPYPLHLDHRPIPKALQRRLFEPFGKVKGLRDVVIQGEHYESIEKSMREVMAVPYMPVEQCLEESTRFKDAGNVALQKGEYSKAIQFYEEAFRAIHIVCSGRRRSIWGDSFFQQQLVGGMYDGQHGQFVRLVLRVRLVANVILAYLKLKEFEEAKFWGMRSINLMRETLEGDEPMLDFPAANEMGKIYYRTGIAWKELDEISQARQLLKIAKVYLPDDPIVRRDWQIIETDLSVPKN